MALVVIAEDNLDHQRVIAEVVRRLGHDVIVANDGAAGLEAVGRHRPDLLIADVDMPHLNGIELCQAIRSDPELTSTPIVLITAYLLPGDPRLSATGALGVIGKPFGVPELSEALRAHLTDIEARSRAYAPDRAVLESLLDCVDTGVIAFDAEGRQLLVNRALGEVMGVDAPGSLIAAVAQRHRMRRLDGSELPEKDWPIWRAMRGENVDHDELMAYDPYGRPLWFMVNARPVRDTDGTVVAAVSAAHNITDRRRTRQYEECNRRVWRVLSDEPGAPDAPERVLAAVGESLDWPYLRLWLLDEQADLLRPAALYVEPGEPPLPLPASFSRGEGLAGRCWESGQLIWVPDLHAPGAPVLPQVAAATEHRSAGAVPVPSGERPIGVVTFFARNRQDPDPALAMLLTGAAAVLSTLLEHRRAEGLALHLAAATDEYTALAGHEVRTPLTSIGSYIDLIAESPDDTPLGEVRDLFEVVHRNSIQLRGLVDRLLDVAGLESGHIALRSEQLDLAELVAAVAGALGGCADERDIRVETDLTRPTVVPGDRQRLRQIIEALISNAIKFSPPGSTVRVTLTDQEQVAVLAIADQGAGIPAKEQVKVFGRLYRGGNARHTGIPGAGLGLALCRVVVERHHGAIMLSSNESSGTTVTVRLPK